MLNRLRRTEVAVLLGGLALLVISLRPWWHDRFTTPASYTPWHASTVWSACVVAMAAAALVWALAPRRRLKQLATGLGVGTAAWCVAYTVDLFVADPPLRGWWGFGNLVRARGGVLYGDIQMSFTRDRLAVVTGESGPTVVAYCALALVVALAGLMTARTLRSERPATEQR